MSAYRANIEFQTSWNETFAGVMYVVPVAGSKKINITTALDPESSADPMTEEDPFGASSFIIAVVLLYGFSIVFMIGSHVVIKPKEIDRDTERQIIKFVEMTPTLKENSKRDNWKNMKKAVIPVVAKSTAKDLVTRRKSFMQIIGQAIGNTGRRLSLRSSMSSRASPRVDKALTVIQETAGETDDQEEVYLGHLSRNTIAKQNEMLRSHSAMGVNIPLDESLVSFVQTLHTRIESSSDESDASSDAEILPAITIAVTPSPTGSEGSNRTHSPFPSRAASSSYSTRYSPSQVAIDMYPEVTGDTDADSEGEEISTLLQVPSEKYGV